jgi:hypothetical protein
VIALPDQDANPSADDITKALTKAAVNVIPLNLFGESMQSIKTKTALWKTDAYFRTKPVQYATTPTETPFVPDTALNALVS